MIDALGSGHLLAAGLDTFSSEPPSADMRLRRTVGVITTPHIAGVTSDAYRNMGTAAAKNILAVLNASTEELI